MLPERPFLQDLALVLCVAAVTTVLFRKLRQPVVLGYLLAGLIVGPYTSFPLFADVERTRAIAELGVILVMFSIGLELSLRRLVHVFPRVGLVALIEISAMFWLGHAGGLALGWGTRASLFAGAMVAISSTMIVAKVFDELCITGVLHELVFGVLVIQDLAAILFLALLTALAGGGEQPAHLLASTAGRLLGFLFVLMAAGYLVVPRFMRLVARLASPETLLVASVGLCFAFALLAEKAGYSVALGAFVAGALVAESGKARQVEPLVRPLRDLFAAIFFVAVGMMVDPLSIAREWLAIAVLVVIVVGGQVTSVALGAFLSGHDPRTALQAGLSLAQIGEFSFIIVGAGVASGAIDPALLSVAVGVSVVTAFLTPGLIRRSERAAFAIEHRLPKPLRTFASLYGSWLEGLRSRRATGAPRFRLVRLAGGLALDALCFAGVVISTALALERLIAMLERRAGFAHPLAHALVLFVAALAAAPFVIGIVRLSRALGSELAAAALPDQVVNGRPDFAAAPRRAFVVALQLAVVVVVGGPLLALTQPFVPFLYEAGAVFVVLALLALSFWRRASDLEAHVRAGAQVVVEALQRQLGRAESEPSLQEVHPLLPGLGQVTPVVLDAASPAVGKTLAKLDLRARTGGTVIAIHRDGRGIIAPTGREFLQAGDVLALAGSREAIEAGQELLAGRDPAPPRGTRRSS